MSRQQYQSHQHFGADDHSNRRGGTTRGGGRPDQQWRGDSGGERADYYASMEDERNFGSYGPYGDGGAEWSDERSGGNYYGRSANRGGTRAPNWGGNSGYGGYGDVRRQYQQRDFSRNQEWGNSGNSRDFERGARGYGFGQQSPESWPYGESSGPAYTDYSGDFPGTQRRGQMPKGYTRSDERIKDDLVDRLYHSSGVDLSEVSIEVKDGKVSLSGSVPERRMKHRIEDFCEHCIGVNDVDNQLRVNREPSGGDAGRDRDQDMRKTASAASDARH